MASIEEEGLFAYKTFRAYNLETTRFENLIQAEPNIRNFLRFERTRKICNEEEGLVSKGVKEKSFRQRR